MLYRRSLRTRVTLAIGLFSVLLAAIYGLTIYNAFYAIESAIFSRLLELELKEYQELRARDPAAPLPRSRVIKGYRDPWVLPATIRDKAAALPDGTHVLYEYQQYDYTLLIATLDDGERIYLLMFDAKIEVSTQRFNQLFTAILIVAGVLLTVLGAALGFLTARRIILPIVGLAQWVGAIRPEGHIPPLDERFASDDEVGFLATTIAGLARRVRAFIDRESRFTRNASHELRTPVAVMKGALQVVERLPAGSEPQLRPPLARMRRALHDMESLINAFLWLAREQADPSQHCQLAAIVRHAVEQHHYLAEKKALTVTTMITAEPIIRAPEAVVYIAVSNLLRNALQYTDSGTIHVRVDGHGVTVTDSGAGIDAALLARIAQPHVQGPRSEGFGLGVSIVTEICERFGWQLALASTPGKGTEASLRFLG
jgi:signal transduction histidine kinase